MTYTVPAGTRIGHVHLKVADLERAIAFYTGVLGFELMQRYGAQAAFVAAGGYHQWNRGNCYHRFQWGIQRASLCYCWK